MHSSRKMLVHLLLLLALASFAPAQSILSALPNSSSSSALTVEELKQLRNEVATQRQTIEALKAAVDQLVKERVRNSAALSANLENPAPPLKTAASSASAVLVTEAAAAGVVSPTKTTHGLFERKPGDPVTFYLPGGELTTYANIDVSVDGSTKGLGGKIGPDGNPPVGNMGWMPALSTNLSYFGIRGFQSVKSLPFNFIYQIETQIDIAATSGTSETNSNESNVVKGALSSATAISESCPRIGVR